MRAILGVLGLVVVVAVIGAIAKKQLAAVAPAPAAGSAAAAGPQAHSVAPKQQVEQIRQGLEATLQQARPMPEDSK